MDDHLRVRLAPLDQQNWRASLKVQVAPEQLPFVAGYTPVALIILAKAYIRPGELDWEPLALMVRDSVVGVLALAHSATRAELLHLSVDLRMQGRGVGSAAIDLVLTHVSETRPACDEVTLTVHPDNERAQRLYRGAGFSPNGQLRHGEPVWLLKLEHDRGSGAGR